jgi:hypothetical protein
MNGPANPVVMLNAGVWHIVESGRASSVALCGRELRDRRAHSRLRTVGRENICPDCLRRLEASDGDHGPQTTDH